MRIEFMNDFAVSLDTIFVIRAIVWIVGGGMLGGYCGGDGHQANGK